MVKSMTMRSAAGWGEVVHSIANNLRGQSGGIRRTCCALSAACSTCVEKFAPSPDPTTGRQLMRQTTLFDAGANPHEYRGSACACGHRFSTFLESREQKRVEPGPNSWPWQKGKRRQNRPQPRAAWGFAQKKKPTESSWLFKVVPER